MGGVGGEWEGSEVGGVGGDGDGDGREVSYEVGCNGVGKEVWRSSKMSWVGKKCGWSWK